MKKFLLSALAAASFANCASQQECKMNIRMEGMPDTILLFVINEQQTDYEKIDTLTTDNGTIEYTMPLEGVRLTGISGLNKNERKLFYLIPGESLEITGSWTGEYNLGGSDIYKEINETEKLSSPFRKEMEALNNEYSRRLEAGENADKLRAEIEPKFEAASKKQKKASIAYIKEHPSSNASLLLLCDMEAEDFGKYDKTVDDNVKKGPLASLYNIAKSRYEREMQRQAQEAKLQPGSLAPDFTLPTIDGGRLSLSDLRGQYVILDFWGSWCGWCIKGMPEMKKYYEKYSGKLEILGVDCRDTEAKWKAAVEKHNLTWKHVKNGEGQDDITTTYAIQGYPTKLIIDPEGKIVKYIIGEDPAFYTALDEVLGK